MSKDSSKKVDKILLLYFNSCLEFTFLQESLLNLLIDLDKVKQKLRSATDIIKLIYFNRIWFHEILYNRDEVVKIGFDKQKKNLYYNFYLNLLIMENPEIVNYTYSLDFIKLINIERKKTSQKYKLIMLCKIIIDLISNYRQTDEFNENADSIELEEIEKENRQIINRNIEVFKEIDLNLNEDEVLKKKIDEIYFEIIIALMRSKKIEDFKYAYNVFDQLDLKNIALTKTILDGLMNGQNYKEYEINNIEDLNDEKKVNFFDICLEFIFKNSIYINNIPFLLKAKKLFVELLKQKKVKYIKIDKKKEYIILKILDSKFYLNKYYENIYEILNEVLKYYEECFFETKIEDIKIIKDIIKNNEVNYQKYEKYLGDYEKAKKINEKIPIINYIYNLENKVNLRNEETFQKAILKLDNFEKMIKERKIEKEYGEMMANFIKDENNNKILSNILNKNEYNYFINYIKEKINNINNNKNVKEILINEKEKENIENTLVKNKNEINNIQYNKPIISNKNFETKINSRSQSVAMSKNEENLDAVEPATNYKNENFAFYLLKKCSIVFHTNFKGKEPYIIYDEILCGDYNIKIDYTKLMSSKYACEHSQQRNELSKNYLKLFNFLKEIEEKIKNEFILRYNLKIKLNIKEEDYNNNSDSTYNISCIYTFYDPINNSIHKYEDKNILINGTNSLNQGFQHMLYDINNECYTNLKYQESDLKNKLESSNNKRQNEEKKLNNNNFEDKGKEKEKNLIFSYEEESTNMKSYFLEPLILRKAGEESLIEYIEMLDSNPKQTQTSVECIYETQNGNYVSGSSDNSITVFDRKFKKKIQIKNLDSSVFDIKEKNSLNKKELNQDKIELLCCTNQVLTIVNIDLDNIDYKIKTFEIPKRNNLLCFEMRENNYVISGIGGTYYYVGLFNNVNEVNQTIISKNTYRCGIKINNNIIALASNSLLPQGENELIFYNIKSKKVSNKIDGFSFTINSNCLALMPREETKANNKILLCACKKYKKNEKNGILLVNPQLQNNKRVNNEFYDTGYFEVYCFCPILLIENKNKNLDNIDEKYRKNIKIEDSEYFLVGGFDIEKREGLIKLYKVIYSKEVFETRIKFIQDINIDITDKQKFEYFDGPINCIFQSKITGNILVSCYNGKLYLLTSPNIDYYINKDKN